MRFILFVCIWLLTSPLAIAQYHEYDGSRLFVGGGAGIHLLSIINQNNYGYSELDYSASIGPAVGAYVGVDFRTKHSIQAGIQYTRLGQKYSDVIGGRNNKKEVRLQYLRVPIVYRYVLNKERGWAYGQWDKYISTGVYYGRLIEANVDWTIDGSAVSMSEFVNQNGNNANAAIIAEMGEPSDDKALFESTDIGFLFGGGIQKFLREHLLFYVELTGTIGVVDLNAEAWRLLNNKGEYGASRNANGGIRIGVSLYLN